MLQAEIQAAIDGHSHQVEGIRHQFKLHWAALEPRWSSRSRRYLLEIEVRSDALGASTIHIVAHARTTSAELLRLVDDALEEHLTRGASSTLAAYTSEVSADAGGLLPVPSDSAAALALRATNGGKTAASTDEQHSCASLKPMESETTSL